MFIFSFLLFSAKRPHTVALYLPNTPKIHRKYSSNTAQIQLVFSAKKSPDNTASTHRKDSREKVLPWRNKIDTPKNTLYTVNFQYVKVRKLTSRKIHEDHSKKVRYVSVRECTQVYVLLHTFN